MGRTKTPMNYSMVAVDKLDPYENNSRTHTDSQITKIAMAIQEFGFINPVVVREGVIVAGHARVLAAQSLSMTHVPTLDAGHLTEEQARAYVIADNRLHEDGGWDEAILRHELHILKDSGYDLNVTGMGDDQLKKLVNAGYDPTLNPHKGGLSVDGNSMDRASGKLGSHYEEAGEQDLVDLTCPHCGEDFRVQKGTV